MTRIHPLASAVWLLMFSQALAYGQADKTFGDWPQWRGPLGDGVSRESGQLRDWPKGGPPVAWEVQHVGRGYSSLAVRDGRIFTQGDLEGVEHVLCLSARDGALHWAVQPEAAARRLTKRVNSAIERLDADRDSQLDEAEATVELEWRDVGGFDKSIPGDPSTLAAQRAARLLAKLDKDRDGRLSFSEVRRGMARLFPAVDREDPRANASSVAESRTRRLFAEFDKDRDGRLSPAEAAGSFAVHTIYTMDRPVAGGETGDGSATPEEVTSYLLQFERGRDGILTRDELVAYFHETWPGRDGILSVNEMRSAYGGFRDDMGTGPRSTPTVDEDRVFALGCTGDLSCLETNTGKTVWAVNLLDDFGGRHTGRGYCESPLVDGELIFATAGGPRGTIVALDKKSGKQVWRSTITDPISYASPVAADIAGVRTLVQFTNKGLVGLDARTGALLWRYDRVASGAANVCTPIVSNDHVFAASAYGVGGGLAKISKEGDRWKVEEVYFNKRFTNHHGGVVKVGDYLYGTTNTLLVCMEFMTGRIRWTDRSVGKGSIVAAGDRLVLVGEDHKVALVETSAEGYREHGRFVLPNLGWRTWSHPVVAGGRLYLRNQERLTAFTLNEGRPASGRR